jgi:signal transduction histidine kinase
VVATLRDRSWREVRVDGRRYGRWLTPAVAGVAGTAFAVGASSLSWRTSRESLWFAAPVRLCGLFSIALGVAVWGYTGRTRLGVLAVAAGTTYYLQEFRASGNGSVFAIGFCLAYLWTAVLTHLVLAWPDGVLGSWPRRCVVAWSYLSSTGSQVVRYFVDHRGPPWWYGIDAPMTAWTRIGSILESATALVITGMIVLRWLRTPPADRLAWPVWAVFILVSLTAAVAGLASVVPAPGDAQNSLITISAVATALIVPASAIYARLRHDVEELVAANQRALRKEFHTRQRIQRNVHHRAQAPLYAALLDLDAAETALTTAADRDLVETCLRHLRSNLAEARQGLGELTRIIYPTALADYGLAAAIDSLADQFRGRIRVVTFIEPGRRWDPALELSAFVIVSEGLVNSVKHAHATGVEITVRDTPRQLVIEVADDGTAPIPAGILPQVIWDQTRSFGGQLLVDAKPAGGSRITAMLPKPPTGRHHGGRRRTA